MMKLHPNNLGVLHVRHLRHCQESHVHVRNLHPYQENHDDAAGLKRLFSGALCFSGSSSSDVSCNLAQSLLFVRAFRNLRSREREGVLGPEVDSTAERPGSTGLGTCSALKSPEPS